MSVLHESARAYRRSTLPMLPLMLIAGGGALGCSNSHGPMDPGASLADAAPAFDAFVDAERDTDGGEVDVDDGLDSDDDGLSDAEEAALGTSPFRGDTDGDDVSDLLEHYAGTDPLDASDTPRDAGVVTFTLACMAAPIPDERVVRVTLDETALPAPAALRLTFQAIDPTAIGLIEPPLAAPEALDCTALAPFDGDADGSPEGLRRVAAGDVACWRIRARRNESIARCGDHHPLLSRGRLVVSGARELDERRVLLIIPPEYCPVGSSACD